MHNDTPFYQPGDREELLAGIHNVDWHTLQHAYGPADDVPDLLHQLLSSDEDVRTEALQELFSNIWHQGTVYEASAYAVPFLLRMLADARSPDRLAILFLLTCLATGSSYLAVHHREDSTLTNWRKLLADKGRDVDTQLQQELGRVRATNEAVATGIELFLTLLEDDAADAMLRQQALPAIAALPSRATESVPRLQKQLAATDDQLLRTRIALALHDLMDDSPAARHFFVNLLHGNEQQAMRLVAAVALLARARAHAPQQAMPVVLAALRELGARPQQDHTSSADLTAWQAIEDRYDQTWGEGMIGFSLQGLMAPGGEATRSALLQAVQLLHNPEDAELIARRLLDLVFQDGRHVPVTMTYSRDGQSGQQRIHYSVQVQQSRQPHELTNAQREVLYVLADHDPLWEHQSNLLELYGLPIARAALRTMLQ